MNGPRTVPDERMCIWCGRDYKKSDVGATDCLCSTCEQLPEQPKGAAVLEWTLVALGGQVPPKTDRGQPRDTPWPDKFPVITRDKLPVPDRPTRPKRLR